MKLVYPDLQNIIPLSPERVSSLVIEEPGFFYEVVRDLKMQHEGMEGKAVLSQNDEPVAISKNLELVIDCIDFDVNRKTLLSKVVAAFEKRGQSEEHVEKSQWLLAEMERYVLELSFDFDIDVQCDKISIAQILKAVGLHIEVDAEELTERLYSYMQLVREFDKDKVFVFVNLRAFVKQGKLQDFADTAVAHGYRVLLLDNFAYPLLHREYRLVVDGDLCEILYES